MFKSERMILEGVVQADERRQDVRKKLLKFMEENPEMSEYIKHVINRNTGLGIILGILLSLLSVELILIGVLIG